MGDRELPSVPVEEIVEIEITPDVTASLVIGQSDFKCGESNRGGRSAQNNSFNQPWGISGEGNYIAVTDSNNNRVLIWKDIKNDRPADLVLGQATFTDNLENRKRDCIRIKDDWLVGHEEWTAEEREIFRPDVDTLSSPTGICMAKGRLFVADTNNHRILIWNSIPVDNGGAADVVIGQPDFVSSFANRDGNLGAGSLFFPAVVFSDGARLFVADRDNHRVLIWNSIPLSNGEDADLVLGQPDFKSRLSNTGKLYKAGADTLSFPTGVFYDGSHLFVADQGNNRILIWDHLPMRNGEPADIVLGQRNPAERDPNMGGRCGANSLKFPGHLLCKDKDLYVVDQGNNRILIWKNFSWREKGSADIVIGQPNFESNEHHWRLVKMEGGSDNTSTIRAGITDNPSSYTLWDPSMLWVDGQNRVFILDRGNNRVVVWN